MTDEGDTIRGEAAQHGGRKKPGREGDDPGLLKQMTAMGQQLLKVS